ncbi:MAG TPA: endonuclease/exonuclease/phosphatase family protein [Candidatus Saccharimonadales bacterium]|nr:endonuclease/exonuclease/phosphatase family protein [Candidatus Saccharimonadales bacterium]
MSEIILATANTHFGRMTRSVDGLQPIAHADILTLQEQRDPEADKLQVQLDRNDFTLVHAAGRYGLAMAIRTGSSLAVVPGSQRQEMLKGMNGVERRLKKRGSRLAGNLPERGIIAVQFIAPEGPLSIATAHPLPPLRRRSRNTQIGRVGLALADPYYNGNLIVAGDWNHYPAARLADIAMRQSAQLSTVDIGSEPTWGFRGLHQEWAARAVSMVAHPSRENLSNRGEQYLDSYDGQLDAVLYRGDLQCTGAEVVSIESDHRAIVATFELAQAPF